MDEWQAPKMQDLANTTGTLAPFAIVDGCPAQLLDAAAPELWHHLRGPTLLRIDGRQRQQK